MEVSGLLKNLDADFIALQEACRPHSEWVHPQFRSFEHIELELKNSYPYTIFWELWHGTHFEKNWDIYLDFGWDISQGNALISKYPSTKNENSFYQWKYSIFEDATNFRRDDHPRAVLIWEYIIDGKQLRILNVHGIWNATRLWDSRTHYQIQHIIEKSTKSDIPTLVVWDFNLLPTSPDILEMSKVFRNLVSEYGIVSTRPVFDDGLDTGGMIVDYIFASKHILVENLTTINTSVSDHFPLILDFSIE